MILNGQRLAAKSGRAKRLVLFAHGYGSNGQDLIGLAPYFAALDNDADFFSPDAIEPTPLNPGGYQWFPIPYIDGSSEQEMVHGLMKAHHALRESINYELEIRGLGPQDLILIGFSQGTMLSLHSAFRFEKKIGGVIGFSGSLLFPDTLKTELKAKPATLLVHGENDDVVPVNASIEAEKILRDLGVDCHLHISPRTAHGIAPDGLEVALEFYRKLIK